MVKTATSPKSQITAAEKRKRRTPEEIVADYQAKIESVKTRAAAKEVKSSDEGKAFLAAVKALDKAAIVAEEADDSPMAKSLESARATLGEHLVKMGVRAPVIRGPRKRKATA